MNGVFQGVVSVVGLGYIGLPTAAVLAARGLRVIGVDANPAVVEVINRGEIHIVEPSLDAVVRSVVKDGRLTATTVPDAADAFVIAVPTPFKGGDHEPDLRYVEAASRSIAPVLKAGDLVILESTSPVGSTDRMEGWLAAARPDLSFPSTAGEASDIRIAHCPERVLPGRVLEELVSNDRIVGGMTGRCGRAAKALYEVFVEGSCILTDARTAEMCKLAENAFRDVNIAFANELSLICDEQGIDVWSLIRLANRHPRVSILQPGAGVGGHCIAVDPWFIVSSSPERARLIRTAREVNDSKPQWVLAKVATAAADFSARNGGAEPTVAVLGLAFKPDIDDLRESPALSIAAEIHRLHGERTIVVEPNIDAVPKVLAGCRMEPLEVALERADVVVVLVRHTAFMGRLDGLSAAGWAVIDAVGLVAPLA